MHVLCDTVIVYTVRTNVHVIIVHSVLTLPHMTVGNSPHPDIMVTSKFERAYLRCHKQLGYIR